MAVMAMKRLILVALSGAGSLLAGPAAAQNVADWSPIIGAASARFGVPRAWIERVMLAESAGRTRLNGRPIRSPAGAMGLMQIMPATWSEIGRHLSLGPDPDDPHDNIFAGTFYLRAMYDRFGYPGLFAAYNAGPARYAAHLASGAPLPAETRAYLVSVSGPQQASPRPPGTLFAIAPERSGARIDQPHASLFMIDRTSPGTSR